MFLLTRKSERVEETIFFRHVSVIRLKKGKKRTRKQSVSKK